MAKGNSETPLPFSVIWIVIWCFLVTAFAFPGFAGKVSYPYVYLVICCIPIFVEARRLFCYFKDRKVKQ